MTKSKTITVSAFAGAGIVCLSALGLQSITFAATPAAVINKAGTSVKLETPAQVELMHIHGLSYSADGQEIFIPSHHGIAVYAHGGWSIMAGPKHDYMGFSATRDALYSSGHPASGSALINPFGIIKSTDGGKTWENLGLEGESDFHILATSYGTNTIYALNHQANSKMKGVGIYVTESDGKNWSRAFTKGLNAKINSLAVHPIDARILAAGADDGLYLSRDAGNQFEQRVTNKQILSMWFDLDGERLWFGSYEGRPLLNRIALKGEDKGDTIETPVMPDDAIAYITQNPRRNHELAIATFKRNVYVSRDQGVTWEQIAREGKTL